MSEDIDFIEIDQLMAEMEEDSQVKKAIATDAGKVAGKPSKPKASSAKKGLTVDIVGGNKPKTSVAKPKAEEVKAEDSPKMPNHGKFMDMVHPMSDMTMKVRPDRKAAPIQIENKKKVASVNEEPARQIVTEVEEVRIVRERIASPVPAVNDVQSAVEKVDPDDEFEKLLSEVVEQEDFEAPFLENIQVEKRPLGGGEPVQKSIGSSESLGDVVDDIANFDKSFLGEEDVAEEVAEQSSRLNKSTKQKPEKKFSIVDFILKVLLVLSIIVLGVVIGWIVYVSGVFEGIL